MKQSLDIGQLSPALERRTPGIWFAKRQAPISYPEGGNARCLAVEDSSFWFAHRNRCIVSTVQQFRPDGPFLDIGGGNGFVSRGLTHAGIQCVLLEPGVEGALAAHERGLDSVICARLEDAALPPDSFAAAGMFDVLEHLEDDASALASTRAILRPGGRLFITVPAYGFLYSADDVAAGHFRRYSLGRLTKLLTRMGLAVDYATYFFAPLPLPIFILRTIPSWCGMARGSDPEHASTTHSAGGIAGRALSAALRLELRLIDRCWRIPIGGSCLVTARRI